MRPPSASVDAAPSFDGDVASPGDGSVEDAALSVVVLSDLNGAYGSTTYPDSVHRALTRLDALSPRPDVVLFTGDMVAGQRPGVDVEAMWTAFFRDIGGPLRTKGFVLAPTPGNHDAARGPRFAPERAAYIARWRRSGPPPGPLLDGSDYPLRYAFERGPALFVSLDAAATGPIPTTHRDWLRRTLRTSDRPAKIVFGHLPLHPVAVGREQETLHDPALERVMLEEGVDLYLSGHHHAYYPSRRGPLHLLAVGCLGGGVRPLLGMTAPSPRSFVHLTIEPDGAFTHEALTGPSFRRPVDPCLLPEHLGDGPSKLDRHPAPPPPPPRREAPDAGPQSSAVPPETGSLSALSLLTHRHRRDAFSDLDDDPR